MISLIGLQESISRRLRPSTTRSPFHLMRMTVVRASAPCLEEPAAMRSRKYAPWEVEGHSNEEIARLWIARESPEEQEKRRRE
jgi:hypothetical protein